MFNEKEVDAEYTAASTSSLNRVQIFFLLIFSLIFNVGAAYYSTNGTLLEFFKELDVRRPELLLGIALLTLSLMVIFFYVIFALVIFRVVFFFIFEQSIRAYSVKFLLLFIMYAYCLVSIWNFINQMIAIDINPLIINLPLSNIISYIFIGFLYYILVTPKWKVFMPPLILVVTLILINAVGEIFI